MHRRTNLGAALAGLALALAGAPAARAQEASTAERTVDAMNALWGKHPGYRANHARGTVVEGSFTPSREAAALSKAGVFAGPAVPVTARYSDATGLPEIADGSQNANPHGLAMKFKLADGGEMDVVINALKYFPVRTGEEFRDLLVAASQSKPDSPKPTPVEKFIAAHPTAGTAGSTAPTPSSLARQQFNGINAFVFVDGAGKRQAFRWRFVPVAGEDLLTPDVAKTKPDGFLMDEIRARLGKESVAYRVMAQIAAAGDATDDATKAWPDERKAVEMGTLTLTRAVPDSREAEKALLFMPNNLPDGIEVSDDPLIDARVQSYAVSYGRRQ